MTNKKNIIGLIEIGLSTHGIFIDKLYNENIEKNLLELDFKSYKEMDNISIFIIESQNINETMNNFIKKTCLDSEQIDIFLCNTVQKDEMLSFLDNKINIMKESHSQ